jgi:hypothetical protein
MLLASRLEIPSAIVYRLAASARGLRTARIGTVTRMRRELVASLRRARRTGTITAPLLGLRMRVYRVVIRARPYDLIVRPTERGGRAVGIVPGRSVGGGARTERVPSARPVLPEHQALALAFEVLSAETEEEVDQFLGKVFKSVSKAARSVSHGVASVGKSLGKVVDKIDKVVPIKSAVRSIEKGIDSVNKVVPIGAIMSLTPAGLAARAAKGLGRVAAGENVFKVAASMARSGLKDVGQVMQLASTVSSFVPGLGTGVGAALGAASALAQGKPITDAVLAAAKGALPGGALAATAFDMAKGLAQGKNLTEAALNAARDQLPGGAAARAAFDTGLALMHGKKLQDAALGAASSLMPSSPIARTVMNGARQLSARL